MKSIFWISVLTAGCSLGQQRQATPFVLPDDVASRKVDILSEGTRMAGEVYALKSAAGAKLPTIIMSHGWGGTVAGLRRDAAAFAQRRTTNRPGAPAGRLAIRRRERRRSAT
jgi:predicted dienelactone hydrolase